MSRAFYITILTLIFLTLLGANFYITTKKEVSKSTSDQAASISGPMTEDDEIYVSLLNIIASSLEQIKLEMNASSTANTLDSGENNLPPQDPPSTDLADAIVNIYCLHQTDEFRRAISGTGFLISSSGAILTNAHVAQFLILQGDDSLGEVTCEARTGNDGTDSYVIDLLYISPSWVMEAAKKSKDEVLKGSGENDFALVYIKENSDGNTPSRKFNFIQPSTEPFQTSMKNQTVILVGYPSKDGDLSQVQKRSVATTTITEIYTFGSGLADVFSVGETGLGYQGASGGPVINSLGRAIGVITTKESDSTVLNAITTSYIDRSMKEETGLDLLSTLQGNLSSKSRIFKQTVLPILREILSQNLR